MTVECLGAIADPRSGVDCPSNENASTAPHPSNHFFATHVRPGTHPSACRVVGKVVGVGESLLQIDGDSIRVMHEGKAEQIRLIGVDCPEERQPFGTRSKEQARPLRAHAS